jgi:Fe-S-cluster containining protein
VAFEQLKAKFPSEGSRCLKQCGKCCVGTAPVTEPELNEMLDWVCKNKTAEEYTTQLHHYDEHAAKNVCPFLTPEKTCFVYPVRPVVCHMFGHLEDLNPEMGLPPAAVKEMSQKCPEGVVFTEVKMADLGPELSGEYMFTAFKSSAPISAVRHATVVKENGEEGIIPRKDGSKPPLYMREQEYERARKRGIHPHQRGS